MDKNIKIKISNIKVFLNTFKVLNNFLPECRLNITKTGIKICELDPASVLMVIANLKASSFEEYKITEKKEIGINVKKVLDVLKKIKKGETLSIELTEEDKFNMYLKIIGNSEKVVKIPLLDLDDFNNKSNIPDLKFGTKILVSSKEFKESVRFLKDNLSIQFLFNRQDFLLKSEDTEINLKEDLVIIKNNSAKCKYSIEYLLKIAEAEVFNKFFTMEFNKDYPLKISYNMEDILDLSFILAPRVEN